MDRYKLEISCIAIVLFISVLYFTAKRVKSYSHHLFSASLCITVFNLIFDIITVYTVNHLDDVLPWVNRACHILFLASIITELFVCYLYSTTLIFDDDTAKRKNRFMFVPLVISYLGLVLLPLTYEKAPQTNYSWGPAVFMVYGSMVFFTICIIINIVSHYKEIDRKKRQIVMLAFGVQTVVVIWQGLQPTILITSAAFTIINLAFFLTVESPDVLLMEKLREEKERADEANEAKSQFLSNMSHEIRTPMNAIVGLTEVLLRTERPDEDMRYLENIKRSGDALLSLINDLLDFSKIESGKFTITEEDYEPLDMLEDLKVMFQNRIGSKPISMKYDIDPDLPLVLFGDAIRIRQVIINLVNNAIKFTDSGFVKLSMQVQSRSQDGVGIRFSVTDSGQGIKKEDLEKLFDAFTQVDIKKNRGKEGTGLGLAICKQLVELMGGALQVQSEYGKGSNFYFTLWQKSLSKETVGSMEDGHTSRKRYTTDLTFTAPEAKVLLVDDNELNREVAAALLAPLNMHIDMAENGLEALQMVQQKEYNLIFMDHYMPIMDGIEATAKIRELSGDYYGSVPILALTADAIAGEREKFISAGMDDVVSKPVRLKEICEKLRYYLSSELIIDE